MDTEDKILLRMSLRHARDMTEALVDGDVWDSSDRQLVALWRALTDYIWKLTCELKEDES